MAGVGTNLEHRDGKGQRSSRAAQLPGALGDCPWVRQYVLKDSLQGNIAVLQRAEEPEEVSNCNASTQTNRPEANERGSMCRSSHVCWSVNSLVPGKTWDFMISVDVRS